MRPHLCKASAHCVGQHSLRDAANETYNRRPDDMTTLLTAIGHVPCRVLVFVRYRSVCGSEGCTPCFSLVRRYRAGERTTHAAHFDIQALVTVVVSLGSYGADFDGGLYVTTAGERAAQFLGLQRGDAVAHQSDLLHGVRVDRGARWSWIVWFSDAADCRGDPSLWHRASAEAGDPIAAFLQAQRAHMSAGAGSGEAGAAATAAVSDAKLRWLMASAEAGFGRAANEVGQLLKDGAPGPSGWSPNLTAAREWFERAAATEPEAVYNLGLLNLETGVGETDANIALFRQAAEAGIEAAAHNMGVAYYNGAGSLPRDLTAAAAWFERAENAEAYYMLAKIYRGVQGAAAVRWLRRAAAAGHPEAAAAAAELDRAAGAAAQHEEL